MPIITIVIGAALIFLGLDGFADITGWLGVTNTHQYTALIPAAVGFLIAQCGIVALWPSKRKHAMHAAAVLSLLGAAAGLFRGGVRAGDLWKGTAEHPAAVKSQLIMGGLCLVLLVLCVRSFILARRRRRLLEKAALNNP